MNAIVNFFELGAIIFAWTIIWNFLVRGWTGAHPDLPAAQGLAAVYHA